MAEMETTIRRARASDAGALYRLLKSIGWFKSIQTEPPEVAIRRIAKHIVLCNADNSHSVYIAVRESDEPAARTESGEPILGYLSVHWLPYLFLSGQEGNISELFVAKSERGQGIGSRLLDTVIKEAKERECFRLALINFRTRDSYQRKFYEKRGWEERPDAANFIYYLKR